MFDPERHSQPTSARSSVVHMEPFVIPDWVQTEAQYELFVATFLSDQMDRGVPKPIIIDFIVSKGSGRAEADAYYQSVMDWRRQNHRKTGRQELWKGLFNAVAGIGLAIFFVFFYEYIGWTFPDILQWLIWILVALSVGGVIRGLFLVGHGIYRMVRR